MSETPKREINVTKDQVSVNEEGQVIVTDAALIDAIQSAQENEEEGISLNFGCVVVGL